MSATELTVSDFRQDKVSTHRVVAAASTNTGVVKAGSGLVTGYVFYNAAAYAVFVKLYNKVSAPVVASDVPAVTIGIPAGASVSYKGDVDFSDGIAIAATKLAADTDATVLVAGDVNGAVFYR